MSEIKDAEREAFESKFPMPSECIRCGDGYAATGYSAWDAHKHIARWEGWKAARAASTQASAAAPQGLTDERINELARTHLVAGDDGEIFGLEKFARALLAEQSAAPMAVTGEDRYVEALRCVVDDLESGNLASISDAVEYFKKRVLTCAAIASRKSQKRASEQADEAVDAFLAEVRAELMRARAKFPGDRIMTIALAEEFGELCKAVLDEPSANVRKEAVQTAVMCARVVLDGDGSVNDWRAERGLDPLIAKEPK